MTSPVSTSGSTSGEAEQSLLEFLATRLKQPCQPDADLFSAGVVTSLFAMELVMYLEEAFGVEVTGEELKLDNFRTVRAMTALVERLRGNDE